MINPKFTSTINQVFSNSYITISEIYAISGSSTRNLYTLKLKGYVACPKSEGLNHTSREL